MWLGIVGRKLEEPSSIHGIGLEMIGSSTMWLGIVELLAITFDLVVSP